MNQKALVVALCIVLGVAALGFAAYTYYAQQAAIHAEQSRAAQEAGDPRLAPPAPTRTEPDRLVVTASDPTSITVRLNDKGDTKTYTVTKDTQIYSLVEPGQVGRAYSDIKPGTVIKLAPIKEGSSVAFWIAFARDASLEPTDAELADTISGTISAVSGNMVTVTGSSTTTFTTTSATHILSRVMAGETAKGPTVGYSFAGFGISTSTGKTTARVMVIAPILTR